MMNLSHCAPPTGGTCILCFALEQRALVHRGWFSVKGVFLGIFSVFLADSTARLAAFKSWKSCLLLGFLCSCLGQSDAVSDVKCAGNPVFLRVPLFVYWTKRFWIGDFRLTIDHHPK
ncbi:hypothetical protein FF011L_12160 [Roseimaritima multifibrata]|uniref:Uncharacterized protein n=1 Tax=Roseimaritima multifibrata TaxID=1930274 RepID=A0A517MC61_9BACT|nr:hypothetical protein FF011L_12160 [Roseimaritima multifibrata]